MKTSMNILVASLLLAVSGTALAAAAEKLDQRVIANASGATVTTTPDVGNAYGNVDTWETHFRLTGASLGGGSGWAILALELMTGELRTFGSGHHTQALATALPLLVMDMYEHSYQIDDGAAALKYIDAFFANVQWDAVSRRLEQAQAIHRARGAQR